MSDRDSQKDKENIALQELLGTRKSKGLRNRVEITDHSLGPCFLSKPERAAIEHREAEERRMTDAYAMSHTEKNPICLIKYIFYYQHNTGSFIDRAYTYCP